MDDDYGFDIDACDDLLAEFGIVEAKPSLLARDECDCGGTIKKMQLFGEFYVCNECLEMKNSYAEAPGSNAKGPNTYQIGSRTFTCYGNTVRDRNDKIADLINHYKTLTSNNGYCLDPELLSETCSVMFDITSHNIKKKDNRTSLFAALLYEISIKRDNIFSMKEIKMILNKEFKYSKGTKIISNAILKKIINKDKLAIGKKIHNLLLSKYLSAYDPEFYLEDGNKNGRNINNVINHKFCNTMIELILNKNIAYNSTIQSKCIAVIYYLVKNQYNYDEVKQRRYFSSIVDIGENTYLYVYNTLISKDTQLLFRQSNQFRS